MRQDAPAVSDSVFFGDLAALREESYRSFHSKLVPTVDPARILGVRRPRVRALSQVLLRERGKDVEIFIKDLPHFYMEEDYLHADFISSLKERERLFSSLRDFLPWIDNWAVCDTLSPKLFSRKTERPYLRERIEEEYLVSSHLYMRRFGINMLMKHFLKEDFSSSDPDRLLTLPLTDYYEQMGVAWYFQQALVNQEAVMLPYFLDRILPDEVLKKARRKVLDSRRIRDEIKERIRTC